MTPTWYLKDKYKWKWNLRLLITKKEKIKSVIRKKKKIFKGGERPRSIELTWSSWALCSSACKIAALCSLALPLEITVDSIVTVIFEVEVELLGTMMDEEGGVGVDDG
ncbi:Hypothetical predicted protein [Prunus dulcis]|uniref:Uncharacterized protein n=1 Tax=Prunus dulcis TaxID=3755 RepID=A0A5E4ED42_PRUDU|nr:Hypothetical predicted protein [Prunus dulcis]